MAALQQSAALLTAVPAGGVLVALQCHTVSALQDPLDWHTAGLALLPALQGTRVQSSSAGRADNAAVLTTPALVVVGYITVARQTAGVTTLQSGTAGFTALYCRVRLATLQESLVAALQSDQAVLQALCCTPRPVARQHGRVATVWGQVPNIAGCALAKIIAGLQC